MYQPSPVLMTDFYKTIHHLAYAPGLEYLTSYWTPRMTRMQGIGEIPEVDKVVMFGLQAYIKDFLIDTFNKEFFNKPYEEIHDEYVHTIRNTMSVQAADDTHLKKLHDLGYLPLKISAVDEGTRIPIRCPMIEITNTLPGYAWLVNYLETPASASIWSPMTSATIADFFMNITKHFYDKTVDPSINCYDACGDFSMRGMSSMASAMPVSAGHLLSFAVTATIPATPWLEMFYNCDAAKEMVAKSIPSMEHSIWETYGQEREFEAWKHLINNVFPSGPLSMVSDTWDYWNVVTNYIPRLKEDILKRDGKIIVRGDSGDPVDIICGELKASDYITIDGLTENNLVDYFYMRGEQDSSGYLSEKFYNVRIGDFLYSVKVYYVWEESCGSSIGGYYSSKVSEVEIKKHFITPAMKGTIECLWDTLGGDINEKGYKVLDKHIGAIYGDGITPQRAWDIFSRLTEKGFAANCVTLGIGSYTYQYVTRDVFGFALKATHCTIDGEHHSIFKDPKTDKCKNNNFKKSQKGMCYVYRDADDNILYEEDLHPTDFENGLRTDNLLTPVFKDGKLVKDMSLAEIRHNLHPKMF